MRDINNCSQKLKDYYQSDKWNEIRQRILCRDNFTCRLCGATNTTLHCHHMHGRYRFNENNHPECLITLCEDCHTLIHTYWTICDSIKEYYDNQRHQEQLRRGYY